MFALDFTLFSKGGPMMAVVSLMMVVVLVVIVERVLFFRRIQIPSKNFVDGIVKNALEKRRVIEALTLCEDTPGPVAAVVKAALFHANDETEKMRFSVQEAALVEIPVLERRLGSIAAVAQVAPLVGLLGTIVGMATTFHAFMQGGQYATARALADGMWQALIVTSASLAVAIVAHLGHHLLSSRVRALTRDMEWAANEIMLYLQTEYRGRGLGAATETAQAVATKKEAPAHDHAPA